MRLTKKFKDEMRGAIIAYHAFYKACAAQDKNGQLVWGRSMLDVKHVFDAAGLKIDHVEGTINLIKKERDNGH